MTGADDAAIGYEVADHVATVTLNRPDRYNSFNEQMTLDMQQAWQRIRGDDDVHVVVVRAAGDNAFCTGMDVRDGPWWEDVNVWSREDPGARLGPKQQGVWKPVVAAVQGMAAGGAMYFLNESDIIICSDDATFFDPHANGGIVSALEPVGMLQRGVPLGDVLRWALMGNEERIGAETAMRLGLVTEVVPREELWKRADDIARQIAVRRPEAIQGTVRAIWEAVNQPPAVTRANGLLYAHVGNGDARPRIEKNKQKPRIR
ncbi:enoyl-CoA hydratase/isomerase family protein [Streptomyces sp. NPDC051572]|uniref:enoyl-CoA hydratase/isomerase family protein n=1 Tax=unclassified Streptomyces TaxID=2593676 RepID=UPI00344B8A7C